MIIDEELRQEGLATHVLGIEKNVQVQKRGYSGADIYLDHDEEDRTTTRYFEKNSLTKKSLRRHYLDDIYGVIDGVRLGIGKAIVPLHLVSKTPDIEVVDATTTLSIPIVLHYYEQPYYSKLHQAILHALVELCPHLLSR
jgi:hypothetical protein